MRSDLHKLTTEQERSGSSNPSKKWGGRVRIVHDSEHLYEDEVGGFHPWTRRRNHNNKSFTDVLSPLIGAIRKNCGRPWDDVYSEFCAVLDRRSLQGHHIFTHLMQEVKTSGLYEGADGKIYEYRAGCYTQTSIYNSETRNWDKVAKPVTILARDTEYFGFYVHPRTGILCDNREYRRGHRYISPFNYPKEKPKGIETVPCTDGGEYRLETVGRGKNKFKAWFHYRVEKTVETYWKPLNPDYVGTYRRLGKFVMETPKRQAKDNVHYNGETVTEMDYFVEDSHTHTKTFKRTANRKELDTIRKYIASRLDREKRSG